MIDKQTIDRIYEAARIEDVVSDFVTLRKRGVNLLGLCPFHDEKTPSFTVSPAKGIFKCFGCGKGGNSTHFIMELEQLSYVEALKYLARKYHIEVVEKELTPEEEAIKDDRENMLSVNEFAGKYFIHTLHNHIDGKSIGISYLRERGFRDDIIKKFQIGYSLNQKDAFTQAALKAGYKKEYLVKTGLTMESQHNDAVYDRFRDRIMFPIHTISGKIIAFGGRILRPSEKAAKYVNSPESEIYHKSNELYGIYFGKQAIVKHDHCYLVEGYTDVISMHQAGIENVVASSGTSLTTGQIRLIHRFTENVTILYDGDAAGIKASLRGIDLLVEEGLNIKVLLLPEGEDPDSFSRKNNASEFIEFVKNNSVDFIRFKTQLLLKDAGNDPVKKAALIQDIIKSIALIPNLIVRGEYVKECSALLDVDEKVLYFEINKQLKKKSDEIVVKTNQQNRLNKEEEPEKNEKPIQNNIDSKLENEEAKLIQMLIKYGNITLFEETDDAGNTEIVSVADYILSELENDNLMLHNANYEFIKNEYKAHYKNENFNGEKYFINHHKLSVSQTVTDLITEKYALSKIHTRYKKQEEDIDRLDVLAPRYIYEYKLAVIMEKRKEKLHEMKSAVEQQDSLKMEALMDEIKNIDYLKNMLSKELDRVLNLL